MNKRLLLNVIIVGLLTFTMIFNVVYQQLLSNDEPDSLPVKDHWQQSYLIPQVWTIKRLEFNGYEIESDGNWFISTDKTKSRDKAQNVVTSWQSLVPQQLTSYSQLPKGMNILVFVEEDSQPLVFRVTEMDDHLHFYRMIDQKKFTFPVELKARLIPQ